jgi:hypothetical protein
VKITSQLLRARHACSSQVDLFERLYPAGLQPTVEALTIAESEGLHVHWCVRLLAPHDAVRHASWCARRVQAVPCAALDLVDRWIAGAAVSEKELRAADAAAVEAAAAAGAAAEAT